MSALENAVSDLFDPTIPIHEALDRHFGPTFRQCTDGTWESRAAVASRIAEWRTLVSRLVITVLEERVDGIHYTHRHLVEVHRRDGTRVRREVCVTAQRDADGRFAWIEETTRDLDLDATTAPSSGPATWRPPRS